MRLSEREVQQLKCIFEMKEMWRVSSRVNVYLYCIEIFFSKILKQEACFILRQLDEIILSLFIEMNE